MHKYLSYNNRNMENKPKCDRVSEPTKKLLKKKGYRPRNMKLKNKYYKAAWVNRDYNLLENQYVVRKYYQKKYNMKIMELEILLYLFPKQYFSQADYKDFPRNFTYRQLSYLINKGHVKIFQEGKNKAQHVYSLTQSAKLIVINYYKLLSGELKIPTISENNPMIRKDATQHEKRIISMFHKLAKENKAKD